MRTAAARLRSTFRTGTEVTAELLRRDVLVDFRPGSGIRIAPHFYTTDEEVDRVMEEIRRILESPAYERTPAGAA